MFKWYRKSDACYVYLSDVPTLFTVSDPNWSGLFDVKDYFKKSRWFTRGWTLQELLAPSFIEFYSADWMLIGTKDRLHEIIAEITGIDHRALEGHDLSNFNVAERMSWAASRKTTRQEDKAYSLLGIFQVNMPLLYGEGRRAFDRLQEAILKSTEDYTIFTWTAALDSAESWPMISNEHNYRNESLLAHDTVDFRRKDDTTWSNSDLIQIQLEQSEPSWDALATNNEPPTFTGRGLRICLPLLHRCDNEYLAFTYCKVRATDEWVCIPLTKVSSDNRIFMRSTLRRSRIHFIKEDALKRAFQPHIIYVPQLDPEKSAIVRSDFRPFHTIEESLDFGFKSFNESHYQGAEENLKKAVALSKRIQGPFHDDTFRGIFGLLDICDMLHRHDDAELLAMDLVQTAKTGLGEKHGTTLRALSYYATIVSKQNRYHEAEEIFSTLENDQCKVHGRAYHGTLLTMVRRANNMRHLEELQEWKSYSENIFKEFREAFQCPFSDDASAIYHYMWFKRSSEHWTGREEMLSLMWQLSKDVRGEAHTETLRIMLCLAFLYIHDPETERGHLIPSITKRHKALKIVEMVADISSRALRRDNLFTVISNAEIKQIKEWDR
jgi:hypothetical protein